MNERFRAQGSSDLWLASSIEALEVAGFKNIEYEPGDNYISGYMYGQFTATVSEEDDGVLLELNSDSQENIELYKARVAPIFNELSKEPHDLIHLRIMTPLDQDNNIVQAELTETTNLFMPNEDEFLPGPISDDSGLAVPKEPWYHSPWFILLVSVLIPPLGIFLMWYFHVFYDKDRKIFTAFFLVYTVLWLWLLYLLFFPKSSELPPLPTETVDESGTKLDQLNAYWDQEYIKNYVDQMPDLIDDYENLYVNNELGLKDGNEEAETIYSKVQELVNGVMSIAELSKDNAAYTLQEKVNDSADLFNLAIEEGRDSINSGNSEKIDSAMVTWNTAENSFYEINYIYEQAVKAANDELNSDQNNSNDVVVVESGSSNSNSSNSDNNSTDTNNSNNGNNNSQTPGYTPTLPEDDNPTGQVEDSRNPTESHSDTYNTIIETTPGTTEQPVEEVIVEEPVEEVIVEEPAEEVIEEVIEQN